MLNLTPAFGVYARHRLAIIDKTSNSLSQERILLQLVKKAKDTQFGKEHDFSSIRSLSEYQKKVPLRKYEDFWEAYWKKHFPKLENITWPGVIPYFCLTSGTTSGTTKYIPYTKEMIKSNSKAALDMLIFHLKNKPDSKIFSGKSFVLGGSTELRELAPGIAAGDLSGIAAVTLPWWAKPFYYPSPEMALIKNWEEKLDLFSLKSVDENITSLHGVPSWMLILIQKIKTFTKKESLKEIWPNFELIVHGGVNFAPYYDQFTDLLKGTNVDLREVYPASEGFIATGDRSFGEGLRLNCNHNIFFEFIPLEEIEKENPARHWVHNLECGINYAIALTTPAGLWSYIIGDTVKFIEKSPPRLLVTGRTSYFLSAFGEHLTGEEVEKAVSKAAHSIHKNISDYSLGALYPDKAGDLGGHLLILELNEEDVKRDLICDFQKAFTNALCELNEDYESHYSKGFGLRKPEIRLVKKGTFLAWMKKRGKLGGQNKVPRLISNQELFSDLREFTKSLIA